MNTFLPCTLLKIRDELYAYSEEVVTYDTTEWVVDIDNRSILQLSNTSKQLFKEKKPMLRKLVATTNRSIGIRLIPNKFNPKTARVNIACERLLGGKRVEVEIIVDKPTKGPDRGKSFVIIKDRALVTVSEAKELARKIHGCVGEFEDIWEVFSNKL